MDRNIFTWDVMLTVGGLFIGMLVFLEIGRRIGRRRLARDPEGARTGVGAIDGAIFGLMGLLLAFSFSGAASRFDARRKLVVEETNAIGTAYLRLDLLSPQRRLPLQELFRRYVDARLEAHKRFPDIKAVRQGLAKAAALQEDIWRQAVAAVHEENYQPAAMLLLPSLNQMIDITTTRTMAAQIHPPTIIFVMLGILLLVSSFLAGIGLVGGKARSWVHILCFAVMLAVTMYVILDLEYPRFGLIQLNAFDQVLIELRQSMT